MQPPAGCCGDSVRRPCDLIGVRLVLMSALPLLFVTNSQIYVKSKNMSNIWVVITQKLPIHRSPDFPQLGMVGAFCNSSLTEKTRLTPGQDPILPPSKFHPFVISHLLHSQPLPACSVDSGLPHPFFPQTNQQRSGVTPSHSITSAESHWEEQQGIKVSILIKLVGHGSIGSFTVSVSSESADSRHRVTERKRKTESKREK